MKLIVAVDVVKTDKGLVAAAVIYPVHLAAPSFTYQDKYGRRRDVTLEQFGRISVAYRTGVLKHLKQSALSWSVVSSKDLLKEDLMCLAVGRALERLSHRRSAMIHRGHIVLAHMGRSALPSKTIGLVEQWLYSKKTEAPWALRAAGALAKSVKNGILS
jgi:hypothetical protein